MQEYNSDAMDALCDETSTPKRARLVATQTRASMADQLQKLIKSTAEPIGKTKNKRKSLVENVKVIRDIHKEVEATPISHVSSTTKVTIRVDGNLKSSGRRIIVASINDGVEYVHPNLETDAEREGTAHHKIDFAGQDNDHGEESEEEYKKTRTLALQKQTKIASVVDPNILCEMH